MRAAVRLVAMDFEISEEKRPKSVSARIDQGRRKMFSEYAIIFVLNLDDPVLNPYQLAVPRAPPVCRISLSACMRAWAREDRLSEVAREHAREPQGTLVISPDNESRRELNGLIRREMQGRGNVSPGENKLRVLDSRQEMTGADRQWAGQYEEGRCGALHARQPSARQLAGRIRACPERGHESKSRHHRARERRTSDLRSTPTPATSKSAWTQAARSRSTSASIRIWITVAR